MSKQITVRGVSAELSRRLARVSRERGKSLNTTVLELLEEAVGTPARRAWLERWATASEADSEELLRAVRDARTVDARDWR